MKKVVLNIGDSSTSGWDSDVVTENRTRVEQNLPLKSAFFNYKTYSDYLRELLGEEYEVINAGVPAHTSYQGLERLKGLVAEFKKNGVHIDFVTIYYGNNDCVWEVNREDIDWIQKKDSKIKTENHVITRTNAENYEKHMKELVNFCLEQNIKPILIKPLIPLYWKPGTRVKNEELPRREGLGSELVYELLDEATELWEIALKHPASILKVKLLEEAKEKDFVVPRIKKRFIHKLKKVSETTGAPLVNIELDYMVDDGKHFVDYCHPVGEPNYLIAKELKRVINNYEIKKTKIEKKLKESEEQSDIPTDHYTLY